MQTIMSSKNNFNLFDIFGGNDVIESPLNYPDTSGQFAPYNTEGMGEYEVGPWWQLNEEPVPKVNANEKMSLDTTSLLSVALIGIGIYFIMKGI